MRNGGVDYMNHLLNIIRVMKRREREVRVALACSTAAGEKCVADFSGADYLEYLDIEGAVTKGS
jgi:hypothetical protein